MTEATLHYALGAGVFLYGILSFCRILWARRRCKRRVNARICDVYEGGWGDKWTWYEEYSPVYCYHVGGQEYRLVSRDTHRKKEDIPVGSYTALFVDEEKPERFHCPAEEENHALRAFFWMAVGTALALVPFLGWLWAVAAGAVLFALVCWRYFAWVKRRLERL